MSEFTSVITVIGAARIALAAQSGEKVSITKMAVGDGGGVLPLPDPTQVTLVNELYEAELNNLTISESNTNMIIAEMTIPAEVGGFWIREVGLIADDGALIAVGNLPETYKPLLPQGSGRVQTIRVVIAVSSTAAIEIKIDPAIVVATVDYVDRRVREAKNRADNAAAFAATRTTFDEVYPPGVAIFFAVNLNPNEKWPGTRWQYTGENKTIRIAKADGSNVGATGGSDTVQINKNNLPAVQIAVSGTASSVDLGSKETSESGAARFKVYRFGEAGRENQVGRFSIDDVEMGDIPIDVDIPPHKHNINLGPHQHSVSGSTDTLGSGEAISIVNSHILLMCWYRMA